MEYGEVWIILLIVILLVALGVPERHLLIFFGTSSLALGIIYLLDLLDTQRPPRDSMTGYTSDLDLDEDEEDDFLLGGGLEAQEKAMAEANRLPDGKQPNSYLYDITDDIADSENKGTIMSYMHHSSTGVGSNPYSKDYNRPLPREFVHDYLGSTADTSAIEESTVKTFQTPLYSPAASLAASTPRTLDGFVGPDVMYGKGHHNNDGDVQYAKRVKYMQSQRQASNIARMNFNANSMRRIMEEEFREQEERDWWGNDDHIYGPL
jgi:hypothetical protein